MHRDELLLAVLAEAGGRSFTPAQIQKALFLITRNLPDLIDEGPRFNFVPFDYGPFDKAVYETAEALKADGLCNIQRSDYGRWNTYAASDQGTLAGNEILESLEPETSKYIKSVAEWVRKQSFSSLVRSIYETYPEMKAHSIFRD